jgi:hypothetical protein
MLKFLLIVGIIVYLIYKIGSFFYRAGAASQHFRQYQDQQRRDFEARNNPPKKATKDGKFSGGEYIDYEEIKK